MFEYVGISSQGGRDYQEDSYGFREIDRADGSKALLCIVADGMGGHAGGATASTTVVESMRAAVARPTSGTEDALLIGMGDAVRAIEQCEAETPEIQGLGSTLVAVVVGEWDLEWLSVGDSPFWLVRDGALIRLNADHSMKSVLDRMVEDGQISRADADSDPQRHVLRSAVTSTRPELIDRSARRGPLSANDILLIASDGLLTLSDQEIADVCSSEESLELIADRLIAAVDAKQLKSQDNTTVVLVRRRPASQAAEHGEIGLSAGGATSAQAFAERISTKTAALAAIAAAAVILPLTTWMMWPESPSVPAANSTRPQEAPAAAAAKQPATPSSPALLPSPRSPEESTAERALGLPPTPAVPSPTQRREPMAAAPAPVAIVGGTDSPHPAVPGPSDRLGPASAERQADEHPGIRPHGVPPPAGEGRSASLVIRSTPPGAIVLIDGEVSGVASGSERSLAPGTYVVQLQMAGFAPSKPSEVHLKPGDSREFATTLCASRAKRACQGDEVWWFDACDNPEALDLACDATQDCSNAQCRDRCVPGAAQRCVGSQLYSFDSCGRQSATPDGPCPSIRPAPEPAVAPAAETAAPRPQKPRAPKAPKPAPVTMPSTAPPSSPAVAPAPPAAASAPEPPAAAPKPVENTPAKQQDCGKRKHRKTCKDGDIWWVNECDVPTLLAEKCRGRDRCAMQGNVYRCR